jgi:hypothetical protein
MTSVYASHFTDLSWCGCLLLQALVDRQLNLELNPPVGPVNNPNITLNIEL